MARRSTDDNTPAPTVYYAPDGREYPVTEESLTAAEKVNLRAWGYSTEKPDTADAEAASIPVPDSGPLGDSAPNPDAQ